MNQEMFQDRVGRVLDKMKERQLSQLIMADPKSIWYLTGVDVDPYERLFALLLRADAETHTRRQDLAAARPDLVDILWKKSVCGGSAGRWIARHLP